MEPHLKADVTGNRAGCLFGLFIFGLAFAIGLWTPLDVRGGEDAEQQECQECEDCFPPELTEVSACMHASTAGCVYESKGVFEYVQCVHLMCGRMGAD